MSSIARGGACALLAMSVGVAWSPHVVRAQGIAGVVRHEVTTEPLSGVLVSVLDFEGTRVRGVLSDGSGGFRIELPLGRYTVRAERIGLRPEQTEPIDVDTFNDVFVGLEMAERAVEIAGLVVDSRVQSCRIDAEGALRIQRWWREVRTALDVSAALQREEFAVFRVEKFEREWDEDLRRIVASNSRVEASSSSRPFSAESVDFLMEGGFVQGELTGQRQYYAPDADVLLSTAFLSRHCFSAVRDGDRRNQLGLRFEPVEGRDVLDIVGTLWVDTTTAELQDMEFRYEDQDDVERNEGGGRVAFDYLPSGAWIISDWYIRMPMLALAQRRRGPGFVTVGYRDVGGAVTQLDVDRPPDVAGVEGAIRGVVFDSIRGAGLPDATVAILGTDFRAQTDPAGQFILTNVPAGTHNVTFSHADTDAWGLGSTFVEVAVRQNLTSEVRLGTPTFRGAALALCLGEGIDARTVLVGHVLDAQRRPSPNMPVRVTWDPPPGVRGSAVTLELRTGSDGRFVACTIPAERPVTVEVARAAQWVRAFDLASRYGMVTYREVWFTR